jgi:hypothetical protein
MCLFAIFPLARSVMLMNFRPRAATECLRAAVENDCALRLQKHNRECAFSVFIVWKNSAPTDLFESASWQLSWMKAEHFQVTF